MSRPRDVKERTTEALWEPHRKLLECFTKHEGRNDPRYRVNRYTNA